MKVVVFLGPSLPVSEARQVLDAVYLPPAKQADLLTAVHVHRPDVIALVDGEFGQSLSVWHKEILYALERGIHVFGASSMGALRAAETETFGTVGVGEVFRLYASGTISGDDEVALAHATADAGYRPLSEPMVNLRLTLQRARDAGVIDADLCERLIGLARGMFFPERSFARLFRAAEAEGALAGDALDRLKAWVAENHRDQKREDALEVLRTIRDLPQPLLPHQPTFRLERTAAFEALYQRDRRALHAGVEVPLGAISAWAALHLPDFAEISTAALNRSLMRVLADVMEVQVSDAEVDAEARRFRARRKLPDQASLAAWLRENDVEPAEFIALMRNLAEARALHRWLATRKASQRITREVLDELRLRGRYADAAARAAVQERIVSEQHPSLAELPGSDLDTLQLVVDHMRATGIRMDTTYAEWSEDAGFHRVEDMRLELLRARAARAYLERVTEGLPGADVAVSPSAGEDGEATVAEAADEGATHPVAPAAVEG